MIITTLKSNGMLCSLCKAHMSGVIRIAGPGADVTAEPSEKMGRIAGK